MANRPLASSEVVALLRSTRQTVQGVVAKLDALHGIKKSESPAPLSVATYASMPIKPIKGKEKP